MPPKRPRGDSSPSKSSPPAADASKGGNTKGKGKAKPPIRVRDRTVGDSDEEDVSSGFSSEDNQDDGIGPGVASFVTESSGDAYLLHSARPSKTSDSLLSTFIDPAFTRSSYTSSLRAYDLLLSSTSQADALDARHDAYVDKFPKWLFELQEGFNILLYGFGSKMSVLNAFAEDARSHGTVIVVDGYDPGVTFADVVFALEELLRSFEQAGLDEAEGDAARKRGKKRKTTGGNGSSAVAMPAPPPQARVSAIEGRVRRVCQSLRDASRDVQDIYLVVHTLDGPALRVPKTLSLLALLAAQPRLHLVASVDHIRAALLFPTSLATARQPSSPIDVGESRAFTFLYHEVSTLRPYSTEVAATGLLSSLLPPSVFPRFTTATSLTSLSSNSLAQSTLHVLTSVTALSKRLFALLASLQLINFAAIPSTTSRSLDMAGIGTKIGDAAPQVAIKLESLVALATDHLIATHADRVQALLAEFTDHGVVRSGVVPPVGLEDEEDGTGTWIWIPLGRDELQDVVDSLEEAQ